MLAQGEALASWLLAPSTPHRARPPLGGRGHFTNIAKLKGPHRGVEDKGRAQKGRLSIMMAGLRKPSSVSPGTFTLSPPAPVWAMNGCLPPGLRSAQSLR